LPETYHDLAGIRGPIVTSRGAGHR
jgi:hypothetical protein